MSLLKIHNGDNYAHAQTSNADNFCSSYNSTKFIRTFNRQFLKGNNMGLFKIHKGENYSHAQVSSLHNLCSSSNSTKFIRPFM